MAAPLVPGDLDTHFVQDLAVGGGVGDRPELQALVRPPVRGTSTRRAHVVLTEAGHYVCGASDQSTLLAASQRYPRTATSEFISSLLPPGCGTDREQRRSRPDGHIRDASTGPALSDCHPERRSESRRRLSD